MSIAVLQPHNQTLRQELIQCFWLCAGRKAEQPSHVASSTSCVSSKVQQHFIFVIVSQSFL